MQHNNMHNGTNGGLWTGSRKDLSRALARDYNIKLRETICGWDWEVNPFPLESPESKKKVIQN